MEEQAKSETADVKVYKTKLRSVTKEQHEYLMSCARVSDNVKSWYVKKLLEKLKEDNVTVLMDFRKEIRDKYSPVAFSKLFNAEKKVNPELYYYLGYSSTIFDCMFQNQKTNWKKKVDNGWFLAMNSAKKNDNKYYVQYNKKGRRFEREITDFYHIKGFPNYPTETRNKSFTIAGCKITEEGIRIPGAHGSKKLGVPKREEQVLRFWERSFPLDDSHINSKNSYTTFSYDGKDWWVSITVPSSSTPDAAVIQETSYKYVLGIDAGIKTAITCSDGTVFTNPMIADKKLQKLLAYEKLLNVKMQRNLSKYKDRDAHYYTNQSGKKKMIKSCRYKSLKKRHDSLMVHIDRYKEALLDRVVRGINWGSISEVHLEDLNKSYWFKNHKWSSKLQKQCVGRIISAISIKAKNLGIPVVAIPQTKEMASSQMCSNCGHKNSHMKDLSQRIFVCTNCGHTLDRDLNAAINLANYVPKSVDKTD